MIGKTTNYNSRKAFYLKQKSKDATGKPCAPYFNVRTKDGENYVDLENATRVSGNLAKLDITTREYNGEEMKTVSLILEDAANPETYFVQFGFSQVGRQLFNTLISLEDYTNVEFSLYERKKDDKSYPAIAVWQNGNKVAWKFKLDEMPKIKVIEANKKKINDYTELNEFLEKQLLTLKAKIAQSRSNPTPVGKDIAVNSAPPQTQPGDAEDVF